MKTPHFFALIAALTTTPALAGTCTSVESATAENFLSCPKAVQKTIYLAAPKTTASDLQGRVFQTKISSDVFHLSATGDEVCLTGHHNWYGEIANFGTLAHLKANKCSDINNNGDDAIDGIKGSILKTWSSLILLSRTQLDDDSQYLTMHTLTQTYPINEADGERIMWDPSQPVRNRVEAFAAVTWNLTPGEKTLKLMDFVRDPAISTSAELAPLVGELIRVAPDPEHVSKTLYDLVTDSRISRDILGSVVKQSAGYVTPALSQALSDRLSEYASTCGDNLNDQIFSIFPTLTPAFEYSTAQLLSKCRGSSGHFKNITTASTAAIRLNMKSIILPLVDYLTGEMKDLNYYTSRKDGISNEYRTTFISAINAITYFRSDRALPVLENSVYVNSKDAAIASATRKAIDAINAGIQIALIKKANTAAIQWGMDMIRFHNGSAKAIQMEVLGAYKTAMKVKPSVSVGIKAFLRKEVADGYHSYDQQLVDAMKAVAN